MDSPPISVRNLTHWYRRPRTSLFRGRPEIHTLHDVSFDVHPGERFGIVGQSGSGKSTLLRILAGVEPASGGAVDVCGIDTTRPSGKELRTLRRQLQMVQQDPMSSLDPRMRVADIIAEPLVAQRQAGRQQRVQDLLEQVGLPKDARSRYPHQFSGGQRQRISIARAIAPRPSVLLADEPVSALDVSVRAQILNLLTDLVQELSLTLVFVSHDLSVVRHLCDRVAVIEAGHIVEIGPTKKVYARPQHPYTKRLMAATPNLHKALAGQTTSSLASVELKA